MKLSTLEAIFAALNDAGVRYLVAGGVAVNVHGYQRLTQDLDLVLELAPENTRSALHALAILGYRPMLPVDGTQFADAEIRREWIEDRNLQVFSLISDRHAHTTVDIFAEVPFDFDAEFSKAWEAEIAPDVRVPFVSLPTLIDMKAASDRPRDRDDADHLRVVLRELEEEEGRDV